MSLILGAKINSAPGGTISTITGYTVHTFASSGNFVAQQSGNVEVLVVGGGGGGHNSTFGGGGGGGSVLYQKFIPVLSGVAYTMTVGSLGFSGAPAQPGGITTCTYNGGNITAPGGGAGGSGNNPLGSGGGGGPLPAGGLGANIIGYGFSGLPGLVSITGGGGGGAGGIGVIGNGGIGLSYSISGVSSYYGGGGGGYPNGVSNPAPSNSNFGYGGRANGPFGGGNGVIIIRYPS